MLPYYNYCYLHPVYPVENTYKAWLLKVQRGCLGIFIVFITNITVNNEYLDLSIIALMLNHGNLQQLFYNNHPFIRINNKNRYKNTVFEIKTGRTV